MKYEELIGQLCEVIKESESNAQIIYDNTEIIENIINESILESNKKERIFNKIADIYTLLQNQDLHRQKIERVVNFVCDHQNIDKSQYNLAPSAKNIGEMEDMLSEDELEMLIKEMQQS